MGHWHKTADYSSGGVSAWYPGTPEALKFGESEGQGNVLLVTIDCGQVKVEARRVGRFSWVEKTIDVSVFPPGGALEVYRKAQEEGLVGHVGITSHSLDVLDRSLDDGLFDTIMVCFSFLEPRARDRLIPRALERNIGVIAMKPFSGGVIDDPRLALNYALAEPGVLVIAGVEHPALFDANWAVFREMAPLTSEEKLRIAEMQQSYDKVFCRRCDYCQPCSEGIPIQTILGMRSMVRRMGKNLVLTGMFKDGVAKARNCTECGDCMTRCPYQLPIPDLIKENLRWLDEQAE